MRANFLCHRFETTQFEMNVITLLKELFIEEPSLSRTMNCQCGFVEKKHFPVLELNNDTFNSNMSNLESSIRDNLIQNIGCTRCKAALEIKHVYRKHIFVEVSSGKYKLNEDDDPNPTMYEPRVQYELADIPVSLFENRYILVAAFLYHHGAYDDDIGHYTVAVKFNEKWEQYDDYKSKTSFIKSHQPMIIHALFYVYNETTEEQHEMNETLSSIAEEDDTEHKRTLRSASKPKSKN